MQPQLPFDDLNDVPPPERGRGRGRRGSDRAGGQADPHLRAAWRLARSMRRYRSGSEEETRAGLAICRHLQALLNEPR